MMEKEDQYNTAGELDSGVSVNLSQKISKKKRFSKEQIRSLERIFDTESSRLKPRKKLQVAIELGLHRRQIAIWFQNRRARRKSKQIERDYSVLRKDYDALVDNFEALKQEKQALLNQLQKLSNLAEKRPKSGSREKSSRHEPDSAGDVESDSVNREANSAGKGSVTKEESDSSLVLFAERKLSRMVEKCHHQDEEQEENVEEEINGLEASSCPEQSSQWCDLWLGI